MSVPDGFETSKRGWAMNTQHEFELLSINQHITTKQLEDRIEHLKAKIEYSDAYDSCMQYRDDIDLCEKILHLRKKWGIL